MSSTSLALRQVRFTNKAFWRNPASAFFTFAFPLIFLVIFTALLGGGTGKVNGESFSIAKLYVPGIAAFSVITACYTNLAISVTFAARRGHPQADPRDAASRLGRTSSPASCTRCFIALLLVAIVTAFGRGLLRRHDPDGDVPGAVPDHARGRGGKFRRDGARDHVCDPERRRGAPPS